MDTRRRLLVLAAEVGQQLRSEPGQPMAYHTALDLLAEVEDTLLLIATGLPETSTLSGKPNGFLPTRHPAVAKLAERISYAYPTKTLPNTLSGHAASIHPALRPTAQTEDFDENI